MAFTRIAQAGSSGTFISSNCGERMFVSNRKWHYVDYDKYCQAVNWFAGLNSKETGGDPDFIFDYFFKAFLEIMNIKVMPDPDGIIVGRGLGTTLQEAIDNKYRKPTDG